jgi:hypothetical protein
VEGIGQTDLEIGIRASGPLPRPDLRLTSSTGEGAEELVRRRFDLYGPGIVTSAQPPLSGVGCSKQQRRGRRISEGFTPPSDRSLEGEDNGIERYSAGSEGAADVRFVGDGVSERSTSRRAHDRIVIELREPPGREAPPLQNLIDRFARCPGDLRLRPSRRSVALESMIDPVLAEPGQMGKHISDAPLRACRYRRLGITCNHKGGHSGVDLFVGLKVHVVSMALGL